jgi:hypothetical protein
MLSTESGRERVVETRRVTPLLRTLITDGRNRMGRAKKTKPATLTPEFQAAQSWYKMECANYCFELVRDVLRGILNDRPSERSPNYYAMLVGLICTYARPFTYNEPVGKLGNEIVPDEFKELHKKVLDIRHKLFAHAEA